MSLNIQKAVIPAAGLGTRLLPITKTQPKEMLPIAFKPLIQFAVEEAVEAGITDIIIITSQNRQAIADYFAPAPGLSAALAGKNEFRMQDDLARLESMADITYVTQPKPLGLGHAIALANKVVGDAPFAVILPDDLIDYPESGLCQMMPIFAEYGTSVLAVETVDRQDIHKYGVIRPQQVREHVYKVKGLVEKPGPDAAPSSLGIVGRYILTPDIFEALAHTMPDSHGEIQLTNALALMLERQAIYALSLHGARYDAGSPLGYLEAQVVYGLRHPDVGDKLRSNLRRLI